MAVTRGSTRSDPNEAERPRLHIIILLSAWDPSWLSSFPQRSQRSSSPSAMQPSREMQQSAGSHHFPFPLLFSLLADRRRERLLAGRARGKGFSVPQRRVLALGLQERARSRALGAAPAAAGDALPAPKPPAGLLGSSFLLPCPQPRAGGWGSSSPPGPVSAPRGPAFGAARLPTTSRRGRRRRAARRPAATGSILLQGGRGGQGDVADGARSWCRGRPGKGSGAGRWGQGSVCSVSAQGDGEKGI